MASRRAKGLGETSGVVWSGEGMGEVWTFPAHSSILTVTNIRMLEKC